VEGKRQGQGVYVYLNGDVYKGEWESDIKHGVGTYIYTNGSKKQGIWASGQLSGPGEIIHVDHKLAGIYFNDVDMKMPVQITFGNGYTQNVRIPSIVGMQPPPIVAD
jgi:radial spoke head protein 1